MSSPRRVTIYWSIQDKWVCYLLKIARIYITSKEGNYVLIYTGQIIVICQMGCKLYIFLDLGGKESQNKLTDLIKNKLNYLKNILCSFNFWVMFVFLSLFSIVTVRCYLKILHYIVKHNEPTNCCVWKITHLVYNFMQVFFSFFYTTVGRFICLTGLCKFFKQWSSSV